MARPGARSHGKAGEASLDFDLIDLLQALGEPARLSTWRCSVDECVPANPEVNDLEEIYNRSEGLAGPELLDLAAKTLQVIDGTFEAFLLGEASPWVKLGAIDSCYWEVFVSDPSLLSGLESRFQGVERMEEHTEESCN